MRRITTISVPFHDENLKPCSNGQAQLNHRCFIQIRFILAINFFQPLLNSTISIQRQVQHVKNLLLTVVHDFCHSRDTPPEVS